MPDARLPSVDRALWNLAEVASRYSDGKSDEERRAVWAAIEAAVTQARSMFDSREAAVAAAHQ
ncbi:MAG: hypothetical protein ACRDY7_12520, partial [Acidimicrobiia bacterium]